MYIDPEQTHLPAVELNDGKGNPRPVQVVAPEEGFKHLGIQQGGEDQWATTLTDTWTRLKNEASRVTRMHLSLPEFRYVVNRVWVPRLRYRLTLGGALRMANALDVFIRQTARSVLRLPHALPTSTFYDTNNGLGLQSCEVDANIQRYQAALRILNDQNLPVHHVLLEAMGYYQIRAGLVDQPLNEPVSSPAKVQIWLANIIRYAVTRTQPINIIAKWNSPLETQPERAIDRSLFQVTSDDMRADLVYVNWYSAHKLRYISAQTGYSPAQLTKFNNLYDGWRQTLGNHGSNQLVVPVGCSPIDPGKAGFQVSVGVGEWDLVHRQNYRQQRRTRRPQDGVEVGYRLDNQIENGELGRMIRRYLVPPHQAWHGNPKHYAFAYNQPSCRHHQGGGIECSSGMTMSKNKFEGKMVIG
ncbi:hypothetical protein PHMEG_00029526 [Phytophthora megakarya]|uniref:Uncharacterized protein n=1 Tax=Phytophthora megakarya TaxID=4795 RepID=A0A225V0W0_9STRA|nr:hypothetical protein PHMEG_00029526 [Phytophthora megakarya]